ncbi:TRAP transporter substrate-binding protein [Lacicoccus qingdaonensis]|uniref:Tripartite ATP-independent transporter solute receptor, DctP family n=1 Tax=Lacicoccus qingdaonensis TaxID=576118 RepID=A0A1G9G6K8_9BACL|nr:TRAP transporter substrate-binding protein [Salinicoccus qingdaonensis]SDK96266.1 tripartite ATP-independent transporter solute receptor, DctP family [Salinicoccus qingdaonensis]
MKKSILLLLTSIVTLAGCNGNSEVESEAPGSGEYDVSFSTWANPGEPAFDGMLRFEEIIEEETEYNINIFPGNQLGATVEQMEQVMMGSIEMMSSGDPGLMEIEMLSLPYLMDSNEHWKNVLESDIGQEWEDQMRENQGLINIGILPRGPRIVSSNVEIETPEDMAGLKIRAPQRDYYVETFRALGASPTPVDFGELYSAIDTGIVTAQENPLETIVAGGFMEIQSDISLTNHMYKPAFITVNNEFFESLSEEDREVFYDAALEAEEVTTQLLEEEEEETLQTLEDNGTTIIEPDLEAFEEQTQSVRDELGVETWGEERYNEIVEMGKEDLGE